VASSVLNTLGLSQSLPGPSEASAPSRDTELLTAVTCIWFLLSEEFPDDNSKAVMGKMFIRETSPARSGGPHIPSKASSARVLSILPLPLGQGRTRTHPCPALPVGHRDQAVCGNKLIPKHMT
jgi:hypothetical protein